MIKSAYLHIPFCEHICHYCDFNKVFLQGQPVDDYLQMMKREMVMQLSKYPTAGLDTVFVGGGTPTSLDEKQLAFLCEAINETLPFDPKKAEYTFEANPGDLSREKLEILYHSGVNRLSFGVQSFNDELLKRIGRTHRALEVYETIHLAQEVGFTNISIDLIYGLPGQTMEDFNDTLDKAIALQLPHYSSYSLIVEPKTVFYNQMRRGKLNLPPQELEASMYERLMEEMEKHGLHQYEISNFAREGFESRHNLTYWDNAEYYGIGAGAHGYTGGTRVANHGPVKKYIAPLMANQLPVLEEHPVPLHERMEEEMFLGLRKTEGVSLEIFKNKFFVEMTEIFRKPLEEESAKGLLKIEGGFVRLTERGKLLGNEVFQSFLGVIDSE
ncbi:radical SAM family heme chaperone HemW [Peribacillus simplex]|uniref:radical SAM family heme chaperone HemW n=1 Tax=Peribacillus TaxID=2675229 RepID=UPI000B68B76D|nr:MULTISPECIES: radical SAM family heme chaperone HemW [Peribacillus]MDM5293843.1 radical SAM family heme chaperone HemW [Peribacillus simplex]MDV7764502.1 radical SAM family heme chaperone HemW [Peribacillus sp. CSMR9]MDW7614482.1 radical SAM family heme chaperone HemW [Peribacillus simplex]SNS60191.1 oxygen-independent coproporphyrinogen-3 oxidase [Bacillus sp. OK838]